MKKAKIVDRIEPEQRVKELSGEDRDDFFTKLIMGKDITTEIETNRGTFVVKYPKSKDAMAIGRLMAYRRNYQSVSSFDANTEALNLLASTLDVVVVSGPVWFEKAKINQQDFSFMDVPDRKLLNELYGQAYTFRGEIEASLDQKAGPEDRRLPAAEDKDEAVGGGSFEGLASK
jgi:hypothetical protein